jgi:type 1 glutamine amidotransferase
LLVVDEKTYDPIRDWGQSKTRGMGDFHPIAWYQEFDGGRSFYTALGHIPGLYNDEQFLVHIIGGIYWAATGKGIN